MTREIICSVVLKNMWVEAPMLHTSETPQLHCFSTFPFRLSTNGLISKELARNTKNFGNGIMVGPQVSSDNQPLAVCYRMAMDKFTHRSTHVSILPTLAQELISIPFPMTLPLLANNTQYLFLIWWQWGHNGSKDASIRVHVIQTHFDDCNHLLHAKLYISKWRRHCCSRLWVRDNGQAVYYTQ
jgi:hypothetical protein